MISAISVKDRLKNQAVAGGKTFQEALTAYGLERTVYRLSVSEYVERFTKTLLLPIVESITGDVGYSAKWDHESRSWK